MSPEGGGLRPQSALSWIRDLLAKTQRVVEGRLPGRPDDKPHDKPDKRSELERDTVRAQVRIVRRAFEGNVAVATGGSGDDSDVDYLYRPGHALVQAEDLERLQAYFRRHKVHRSEARVVDEPVAGVLLVELPHRNRPGRDPDESTFEELDRVLGPGRATPDHLLYVTGLLCPANEPDVPTTPPVPTPSADTKAGKGVRVAVVDTGWWADAAADTDTPWLAGGVGGDLEVLDPNDIRPYGGHGTFVAGVIRCLAPASTIQVEGFLTQGGAMYESEIVRQLDQALLQRRHPQLISISAGTHTRNSLPLLTFVVLAAAHDFIEGENAPLIVAAAGNDGTDQPFWPAAFDWVVGVGALDENGGVSDFSNVGPWVDVYALGRDLVNAFPTGTYACYEPANAGQVRTFTGLARWSGTSFSTPVVTGAVAAHMSANGVNARTAYAAVRAAGQPLVDPRAGAIIGVGPPFA